MFGKATPESNDPLNTSTSLLVRPETEFDDESREPLYRTKRICKVLLPTQVTPEIARKRLTYVVTLNGHVWKSNT
jgi:hypothetical protein